MIDFYCFGSLPKLTWCDKIETQLVVKDDADMARMLRMLLQAAIADITERERAEEALRESEKKHHD